MYTLPDGPQNIINLMKKAGHACYVVGGSVRDIVMGRPIKDWDFTTDATPEEILSLFPDSFYDNQFGTVGIKRYAHTPPEPEEKPTDIYEMTTYRSEDGYTDNRHPDTIRWGKSLSEDLSRRDFTINAIAFDGKEFIDPYHGLDDIKQKVIRAVGDANGRFTEDALRMMRAIRIASQLGFTIETQTHDAIKAQSARINNISAERIRDELLKIVVSPFASDGILLLKNTDILSHILPELSQAFSVGQKSPKRHHIYDVGVHSVMAMKFCPSTDPIVKFATLLHDIGKPPTYHMDDTGLITFYNHEVAGTKIMRIILKRLRFSNKDADRILTLIRWHQFSVDERQTDSAIRRFIRRVGKENLTDMLDLRIGDRLGGGALETSWRLELFKKRLEEVQKQPFSIKDLKINGNDIMQLLDIRPGPVVGQTLTKLFACVEEGTVSNERETLLTWVREYKKTEHM